jgi:hypothetical protein
MRYARLFRFPWRRKEQIRQDIDDELSFHLEMRARKLRAKGVSQAGAESLARQQFGDLELTKEYCRSVDSSGEREAGRRKLAADVWQDVRIAMRSLLLRGQDGRVWVQVSVESERVTPEALPGAPVGARPGVTFRARERAWDVYGPDGVFLWQVHASTRITPLVTRGNLVWGHCARRRRCTRPCTVACRAGPVGGVLRRARLP